MARVTRRHGHHVTAMAQLINIFLQNNLHGPFPFAPVVLRVRRFFVCCGGRGGCRCGRVRYPCRWGCVRRRGARGDHLTRLLCARGAASKGQQGDIACALNGHAQPALMSGTNAGHAPGENLPALLHELREYVGALVVHHIHLLNAELANFLLAEELTLAPARSARSSRTAAWPALAAWSTMSAAFTARCSVTAARRCRLSLFVCHSIHLSLLVVIPCYWGCSHFFSQSQTIPISNKCLLNLRLARALAPQPVLELARALQYALDGAPRASRVCRRVSFFARLISSSSRTVMYLITTSCTRKRRSSSAINSPCSVRIC